MDLKTKIALAQLTSYRLFMERIHGAPYKGLTMYPESLKYVAESLGISFPIIEDELHEWLDYNQWKTGFTWDD